MCAIHLLSPRRGERIEVRGVAGVDKILPPSHQPSPARGGRGGTQLRNMIFWSLSCLLLSSATVADAVESLRNVSLSAKPTASSQFDAASGPRNAIDASRRSTWIPATAGSAPPAGEEWLLLEFDREENLRRAVLNWEFSLKANWRIEILRGGMWTEAARGVKDGTATRIVELGGKRADKVKLVCSGATPMACSLADFQVWAVESDVFGGTLEPAAPAPPKSEPAKPQPSAPVPVFVPVPAPPKPPKPAPPPPAVPKREPAPILSRVQAPSKLLAPPPPAAKKASAPSPSPILPIPSPVSPPFTRGDQGGSGLGSRPPADVRPHLTTLVESFDNILESVPLGAAPVAEASEGCVMQGAVTGGGWGRGGRGEAYRARFVVVPDGVATLSQKLKSSAPSGWSELSFWVRGSWAAGAPLEVVLADDANQQAALAAPGTEGGSALWRQIKIPAGAVKKINRDRIKSYILRFTPAHQAGEVYIDDIYLHGGAAPGKPRSSAADPKKASASISPEPPASIPVSDLDPPESKIQNPKSKISNVLPEVRPFTYDPKDRQAVHEMLLAAAMNDPKTSEGLSDDEFLDLVERRAFLYFWYGANPENGITLDGAKNWKPDDDLDWNSIAAVGFGLTAICIGAERGWISKEMAYERCRVTLDAYLNKIQNNHGFYYHFTNRKGMNDRNTELSSIDSLLMFCGMLFAAEYFKSTEVEKMARQIFERVDWRWMHDNRKFASMAVDPGGKFNPASWDRHCEGQILSILELGHPQNMPTDLWFDMPEQYGTYRGYRSLNQGPLFTFQFPSNWIDFRDRNDGAVNFWENGIEATLANRFYAIEKMPERKGYGPNSWGFTAGDFPGGYHAFAAPPSYPGEDGTVTINAAGGSVIFTPHLSTQALRWMYDNLHDKVWGKYGFTDGYNLDKNWSCDRVIGIGTGPVLLSIENHRTGFVWKYFMQNDYVKRGMERVGFKDEPRRTAKARPLDLAGYWKWKPGDNKTWSKPEVDDSGWRDMYAPDKWEVQLTQDGDRKMAEYDGFGWYRRRFTVPLDTWESWKGQDLFFHAGAIDDADEVFLNGEKIGSTGSMSAGSASPTPQVSASPTPTGGESAWEKPRKYAVPRKLVKVGEDNVIAVRVFDAAGGGGLWMRPVELGPFLPLDFKPWKL